MAIVIDWRRRAIRILLLTQVLPYSPNSGGKIKAYDLIRYLAQQHEVVLVSFIRSAQEREHLIHLQHFCQRVETVLLRRSRLNDGLAMARSLLNSIPFLRARGLVMIQPSPSYTPRNTHDDAGSRHRESMTGTRMRTAWDKRAIANNMYFVASGRKDWTPEEFFESGRSEAHLFLDGFFQEMNFDPATKTMLELGCGVGRMTLSLADMFRRVHALDVSGEMLTQARRWLAGRPNVLLTQGSGLGLEQYASESFDFVFSYIVFQHIPQPCIVLAYVREIGRVLKEDGLFKFQLLVGRPNPLPRLKGHLRRLLYHKFRLQGIPLLDRHRDLTPENIEHFETWLGSSVTEDELRVTLMQAGLQVTRWQGHGSVWVEGHKGCGAPLH